jgi:hypothetical protein
VAVTEPIDELSQHAENDRSEWIREFPVCQPTRIDVEQQSVLRTVLAGASTDTGVFVDASTATAVSSGDAWWIESACSKAFTDFPKPISISANASKDTGTSPAASLGLQFDVTAATCKIRKTYLGTEDGDQYFLPA